MEAIKDRRSMSMHTLMIAIGTLLLAGPALAQETVTLAAEQPSQPVESTIPELSGIVVLCAHDDDEKFKAAWSRYVKDNKLKGGELQKTINYVTDRADAQRANQRLAAGEVVSIKNNWKAQRRQLMNEVAGAATKSTR